MDNNAWLRKAAENHARHMADLLEHEEPPKRVLPDGFHFYGRIPGTAMDVVLRMQRYKGTPIIEAGVRKTGSDRLRSVYLTLTINQKPEVIRWLNAEESWTLIAQEWERLAEDTEND